MSVLQQRARVRPPLSVPCSLITAALAVALAHELVSRGPVLVAAALLAPALCLSVVAHPRRALGVGVALVVVVPYSFTVISPQAAAIRLAALAALTAAAMAIVWEERRAQLNAVDAALAAFVLASIVSWLLTPQSGSSTKVLVNALVPFCFYAGARLVPRERVVPVMWVLVVAGALAAVTVLYEFAVVRSPLFVDQESYYWNGTAHSIFRPGGVFGSPPGAVTVLSMTTLCGLPLALRSRGRRRAAAWIAIAVGLAGIAVTFTRAGYIGFGLGFLLFAALAGSRTLSPKRVAVGVAALAAIFALVVLPSISDTGWYQSGVLRKGNLEARESYWKLAKPLVTDSTTHLLFGRGVNTLLEGRPEVQGQIQAGLSITPVLTTIGPHNQYVRTILEQGLLGLALLALWLFGAPLRAVALRRRLPMGDRPILAVLVAAAVSFGVVSFADDSVRHPPSLAVLSVVLGLLSAMFDPRLNGART